LGENLRCLETLDRKRASQCVSPGAGNIFATRKAVTRRRSTFLGFGNQRKTLLQSEQISFA
jgi:hypothetical protein